MLAESSEELNDAERIINRILQLGGSPSLEPEPINIYQDPETQLRQECKSQHEAMAELQKLYSSIKEDVSTQNLLQDYINSETEHASWLEQQVNLMQLVGVQNYLATQI
jgi:bacterioferritin